MLPVKLVIQAFESYADKTEIDFEKLDSLFLIHGETGAGKTAVLDAVAYALYGESSGGDRTDMRCALPAAENLPTLVEFTFKIRGELYKFTRSITVTPRSKKLEARQDCFYFDKASDCFRAFFENPKQVSVRAKAEELTGLSAEQFRQVIILPQGKFEQLLTSGSRDKEEILSTLFGADKYTRLSDKLWEKSERLRKKLEDETKSLKAMLAAENAESAEQLDGEIKRLSEEAESIFPKLDEARKNLDKLREKLTAAELSAAKFTELDEAEKRLAELEKNREETEEKRLSVKKHENASHALAEKNALSSAEKNLTERRSGLDNAEKNLSSAEGNFSQAEKTKAALAEKEMDFTAKKEQLAVLKNLAPLYEKISRKAEELKTLSAKTELCGKRKTGAEERVGKCVSEADSLSEKREHITREYSRKLPELAARLNELKSGAEAEKRLGTYTSALESIRRKISSVTSEADKLEKEKSAAESRYDKLYGDYIRNAAAELSSQLKEGTPCPVCGSLSHPAPAELAENAVTAAEVKSARAAFELLAKQLSDMRTEIAKEEARIPAAEEYIAAEKKVIADTGYTAAELDDITKKHGEAVRQNELLPKIDSRLKELFALKADLERQLAEETKALENARSAEYGAKAELSALKESLDPRFGDADSYAAEVNRLKADIDAFTREKESSDREYAAAEKLKIEAVSVLGQARSELDSATAARDKARSEFLKKLDKLGISPDGYGTLILSEENAARLSEEIKRYDLDMHTARERADSLKKELEGKTPPPLEEIRADVKKSEADLSELSGKHALVTERLNRLKKVSEEYSRRYAAIRTESERSDKLSGFAGFMRGDKGISFTRYFLGIMLSLVTAEANRILAEVRGGKFRLRVKNEYAANSKQGLDLEAETLTPDFKVAYGVKNLSGGEKFLISLALSLGLSAVARSRNGGIDIEAMFIDEGFGSLDPASLREAVAILCGITAGRSTVGIISHVDELKNVIPCGIRVTKNPDGTSSAAAGSI